MTLWLSIQLYITAYNTHVSYYSKQNFEMKTRHKPRLQNGHGFTSEDNHERAPRSRSFLRGSWHNGALVGPGSDALVLLYHAVFITIRMINSSFCSISVRVQLGIFSPNLTLSFLQPFLLDGSDSRTRQTDRGHTGILLRTQSWR